MSGRFSTRDPLDDAQRARVIEVLEQRLHGLPDHGAILEMLPHGSESRVVPRAEIITLLEQQPHPLFVQVLAEIAAMPQGRPLIEICLNGDVRVSLLLFLSSQPGGSA